MGTFIDWIKTFFLGKMPIIETHFCITGTLSRGLKYAITRNINTILSNRKDCNYKFGKSGCPPVRVDQDDYRSAPYDEMFLLYKSKSKNNVSALEEYYSEKYYNHNDNIDIHSAGKMRSYDGFYYLYMVI